MSEYKQNKTDEEIEADASAIDTSIANMEMEVMMYLRRAVSAIPEELAVPIVSNITMGSSAYINLTQGSSIIITDVSVNKIDADIAKTIGVVMFRKSVKMTNTSVRDFDTKDTTIYGKRRYNRGGGGVSSAKRRKVEEDREEIEDALAGVINDALQNADRTGCEVIVMFFPIRSLNTMTIAASQSRTFKFKHVVYWPSPMRIEDAIVSSTRLSDTDQLEVFCANKDDWTVIPFATTTKLTIQRLRRGQQQIGQLI